jgi:hypothetical protein
MLRIERLDRSTERKQCFVRFPLVNVGLESLDAVFLNSAWTC